MRVIIEIPDMGHQTSTMRYEVPGSDVKAPASHGTRTSEPGEAMDGGAPAPGLLFALGAEAAFEDRQAAKETAPQAAGHQQDGGGVAPWLVDMINRGEQG